MKFNARTAEQIAADELLREGNYPFTIKEAKEKVDKNNKGFFAIKLFVHDDERDWHIYDNVSPEWMAHKLLHLCEGTGLGAKYASGNLNAEDLIDRQGHCEVGQEEAKGKYAAKNTIVDYVSREKAGQVQPIKQSDARLNPQAKPAEAGADGPPPEDDDVPF